MNAPIKRIALIGPESTGKTTLCRELAEYYHTVWVPEYARNYVAALDRKYTLEDIETCAHEQLRSEEELTKKANRFLFCDSEFIIAKVWCEDVFGKTPQWIEETIATHHYDLFLLTRPDIPFRADDVRENPHRREFFFDWYKRELDDRKFNYSIVSGFGDVRLRQAIKSLEFGVRSSE